jgi:hypothetical protein
MGDLRDAGDVRDAIANARQSVTGGAREARRRMTDTYRVFAPVVNASIKIADEVDRLLGRLSIPVFPRHAQLGTLAACIDRDDYDNLSGVQTFALLNIAARMGATAAAGKPLLADAHEIRISRVFPDRIYLEAKSSLVDAVGADPDFQAAPASLHRFNDGSFKQRRFRKGNLQLSYAARTDGRVDVDADIDLYRGAVPHLFGEVLVNHLTGSTTDQFAVREILDAQQVHPIGGFEVLTA